MNIFSKRLIHSVSILVLFSGLSLSRAYAQEAPLRILNRPPMAVLDVQYSPNGQYLARVYAEGRLEVLDNVTGVSILEERVVLPNALLRAKLDWSPSGDQLAVGIGAQIYIWEIESTRLLETVHAGGNEPLVYDEAGYYVPEGFVSVAWDSTGTLLLAQSRSSRYTVWSTEQKIFIFDRIMGNNPVPLVWLADDRHISTGNDILDILNGNSTFVRLDSQPLSGNLSNCGPFSAIEINNNRTQIVMATIYDCIIIRDAMTGNTIAGYQISELLSLYNDGMALAENRNPIWGVSWSPDDSSVVAVDSQGAVRMVDIATGAVTLISQQNGPLYAVDWAQTNMAIAYGGVTQAEMSIFATVSVADVERLMLTEAQPAEFAVTPETDR